MPTEHVPRLGLATPGLNATLLRGSLDLPRNQTSWPVESSRLQVTHSSECATGAQANRIPTARGRSAKHGADIFLAEPLLGRDQLKPEQGSERGCPHSQSEPLVFQSANHVKSAAAPINRAFSVTPASAEILLPMPLVTGSTSEQKGSLGIDAWKQRTNKANCELAHRARRPRSPHSTDMTEKVK